MFTHDLADALRKLASALKRAPNIDINEISIFPGLISGSRETTRSSEDLPMALSALLSFSRFDKSEWVELIRDLGLPIEVRPRDASRDILGKVLKVLEAEPEARERLQKRIRNKEVHGSPELAKALSSLLNR